MKRPGVLIGVLVVILLLCVGAVVLDQTGLLGGAGQSTSSGGSDSSNPYGGLQ